MSGGSSNGSSPICINDLYSSIEVSQFSVRYWKVGTGSSSSSVQNGRKMVLCAFSSILESETVLLAFRLTLLQFGYLELGNGIEVSS
ncbi:hypothetical protein C1645_811853 [Glomus cerebriforme]|uniref:Uncharacterized protein n=1 Tax=Glomus cerebriforme TaxID=658196 RepID=A0A397TMC2_9GLOM|nr:hypothetical protein C1645_811853 [Glomus cerebriforme]